MILWRLIKIFFILGIGYVLYRALWKGEGLWFLKSGRKGKYNPPDTIPEMKKDPICGTYVPEDQAIKVKLGNHIHFFCSEKCKDKFAKINAPK